MQRLGNHASEEYLPDVRVLLLFMLGLLHADPWITSYPISTAFYDKPLVEDRLGILLLFCVGIF